MTVRLAVVAVIVCSQGWGWGGLSQPAIAEPVVTELVVTEPGRSRLGRTEPFTDEEFIDEEFIDGEIPEEILRTEIITEARSPLTGEPMSAADYAQLVDELRSPAGGNLVSQELGYLIYLLQLRRAITPVIPFL